MGALRGREGWRKMERGGSCGRMERVEKESARLPDNTSRLTLHPSTAPSLVKSSLSHSCLSSNFSVCSTILRSPITDSIPLTTLFNQIGSNLSSISIWLRVSRDHFSSNAFHRFQTNTNGGLIFISGLQHDQLENTHFQNANI